jgi:hypothetical protein
MRTLFLLTVLFVLLAFAFKKPNQSAWDFAQQLGVNVASKAAEQIDKEGENDFGKKVERKVMENFSVINQRLKNAERDNNNSAVSDTNQTRKKRAQVKLTKKQDDLTPIKSTSNKSVTKSIRNSELQDFNKLTSNIRKSQRKNDESLAPVPPAQPVKSVSVEPLATPSLSEPEIAKTIPIDGAELAEIGARFERASRWLSEIK